MKLRIILKRDDAQELKFALGKRQKIVLKDDCETKRISAAMTDFTAGGTRWTCGALFMDLAQTDLMKSLKLNRWKLRRGREEWNGSVNEKGPDITEGDEVTLYSVLI